MHLFDVYCSCFMVLSFSLARRERQYAGCLADSLQRMHGLHVVLFLLWIDQDPLPD